MIMSNENKKWSRDRKKRNERKIEMGDIMKSILNKIKSKRKRILKRMIKLNNQKLNWLK